MLGAAGRRIASRGVILLFFKDGTTPVRHIFLADRSKYRTDYCGLPVSKPFGGAGRDRTDTSFLTRF